MTRDHKAWKDHNRVFRMHKKKLRFESNSLIKYERINEDQKSFGKNDAALLVPIIFEVQ